MHTLARFASRSARIAPCSTRAFSKSPVPDAKVLEQLIKENPKLALSASKLAEALKLAGAASPSVAEVDNLANQYVNVKAATSFAHTSASQVLQSGHVSALAREPVRVTVTGAAGAIGYSLIFRIASGMMLGQHQPVILQLLEIEPALKALEGVVMELKDCAFPLLAGVVTTSDADKAFDGTDYALLVGSKPRTKGMERGDLLNENGKIFVGQGKALNKFASKSVKVVVVGNPANTNCLIAASNAPNLSRDQFSALTRLDHDRALAQIAEKLKIHSSEISKACIWGNHSATQFPDIAHAAARGSRVSQLINDDKWVRDVFVPTVQKRGAAIIEARGASSAASAANAALAHMRDWVSGTNGEWTSMAVPSCKAYGIGEGVYFSYPVVCADGKFTKILDLKQDAYATQMIEATKKELFAERDLVKAMLPN